MPRETTAQSDATQNDTAAFILQYRERLRALRSDEGLSDSSEFNQPEQRLRDSTDSVSKGPDVVSDPSSQSSEFQNTHHHSHQGSASHPLKNMAIVKAPVEVIETSDYAQPDVSGQRLSQQMAQIKGTFGELMLDLERRLSNQCRQLEQMQDVVDHERRCLENLYKIHIPKNNLKALIQLNDEKRHRLEQDFLTRRKELESEMNSQRTQWRAEQETWEAQVRKQDQKFNDQYAQFEAMLYQREKEFRKKMKDAQLQWVEEKQKFEEELVRRRNEFVLQEEMLREKIRRQEEAHEQAIREKQLIAATEEKNLREKMRRQEEQHQEQLRQKQEAAVQQERLLKEKLRRQEEKHQEELRQKQLAVETEERRYKELVANLEDGFRVKRREAELEMERLRQNFQKSMEEQRAKWRQEEQQHELRKVQMEQDEQAIVSKLQLQKRVTQEKLDTQFAEYEQKIAGQKRQLQTQVEELRRQVFDAQSQSKNVKQLEDEFLQQKLKLNHELKSLVDQKLQAEKIVQHMRDSERELRIKMDVLKSEYQQLESEIGKQRERRQEMIRMELDQKRVLVEQQKLLENSEYERERQVQLIQSQEDTLASLAKQVKELEAQLAAEKIRKQSVVLPSSDVQIQSKMPLYDGSPKILRPIKSQNRS